MRASEPQPSFSKQIDAWVLADDNPSFGGKPIAPILEESLLLRRIFLCLVGIPPTLDELNYYFSETAQDRYERKVDELFEQPEFVEHWAEKLDVMLMERRANTHIPQDQWMDWLRARVAEKKPLHHLFSDLLTADGRPGPERPAARFLLDRGGDPNLVARDIGRIYFGRDLQCAQCHDHPAIDSYFQTDYHGLFGFVASLHLAEAPDGETKISMIAEKSTGDAPFESVFRKGAMHRVLPHLFGQTELPMQWTIPGEDYAAPQHTGYPPVPLSSRRQQLADAIRSGNLEPFNRNVANRLWAQVFGQGVVDPVDLHHSANPPISEDLLQGLADRLVEVGFDLRRFLRDLLMSETFRLAVAAMPSQEQEASGPFSEMVAWAQFEQPTMTARLEAARDSRNALDSAYKTVLSNITALQTARLEAFAAVDTARAACMQSLDAKTKADSELVTAQQAVAAAQEKLAKIRSALDATTTALAAIGDDAELSGAVQLLQGRTDTITAAMPPLEQAVSEKTSAAEAAQAMADATKEKLRQSQTTADRANHAYQEVAGVVQQARNAVETANVTLTQMEAKAQQIQAALHWANLHEQLTASPVEDASETNDSLKSQYLAAQQALTDGQTRLFLASRLTPLTPEQMGWSFLAANNIYRNYVDKHYAELEAEPLETRRITAVRRARVELQANINLFVSLYGAGPGQSQSDFFATPDQALYANNGGAIFYWAAASGDNVTARIVGASNDVEAANHLYRGVLCRNPTEEEIKLVRNFLSQTPDQRPRLAQEMVWSLMVGAEFRFTQ